MTLIVTRTSCRYAMMVTDRKVTACSGTVVVDPDANKNIVFSDKNAVVAFGYTGMAFIGKVPTDQWIVQTLTGLTFIEGRRGRGTVPALIMREYETEYFGRRVRNLMDRLNAVRQFMLTDELRRQWTARSFDIVITGFEWNHGDTRPYLAGLSKPPGSDTFEISQPDRHFFVPKGNRFPIRMCAAPRQNITDDELESINSRLDSVWGDGHGTPNEIADHAVTMVAEKIQVVSEKLNVVGPDTMSILIPSPLAAEPIILIRYIPAGRDQGVLSAGGKQTPVQVAFSPWIVSPGCIRSPSIFTNDLGESAFGPYRVKVIGPTNEGMPQVLSSQKRPTLGG